MSILKQALLSLVVILIAVGGWTFYQRPDLVVGKEAPAGSAGESARTGAPGTPPGRGPGGAGGRPGGFDTVTVVTAPVEIDTTGTNIRSIGTASAARSVVLYPQVTGIISELDFTPGGEVTEGQVVVRLDSSDQEVAVDRAKVALQAAKDAMDRADRLSKTGSVTAVALSLASTAEQQAEIDLRSAELELAKRTIRAPFAGSIGLTDLSVGDLVSSSKAIATVDDMNTLTVAFDVPESATGQLALGQKVAASTAALAGTTFDGTISAIDSRVNPETRTLTVKASVANEDKALKPGMAVTVDLAIPGVPRPSVPSLAIQWDRQGSFVWLFDGQAVHRTPVQIVARRSGQVTVAGALEPGNEVVTEGVLRLRDGMKVARSNESAPPSAAAPGEGETPVSGAGGETATVGRNG